MHELRDKLDNSQLQEQSEICSPSTQLTACNAKVAIEAGEKERIKAKMEAFKGKLNCAVIQIKMGPFPDTVELGSVETQATISS